MSKKKIQYDNLYLSILEKKKKEYEKIIEGYLEKDSESDSDNDRRSCIEIRMNIRELEKKIKDLDEMENKYDYMKIYLDNHEEVYDTSFETLSPNCIRAINRFLSLNFGLCKNEKNLKKRIINCFSLPVAMKIFEYMDLPLNDFDPKFIKFFQPLFTKAFYQKKSVYLKYRLSDGYLCTVGTDVKESTRVDSVDIEKYSKFIVLQKPFLVDKEYGYVYINQVYKWTRDRLINIHEDIYQLFHRNLSTFSNYQNSDFYQYLITKYRGSLLEEDVSKEKFTHLLRKYIFQKIVGGERHLYTLSDYMYPFHETEKYTDIPMKDFHDDEDEIVYKEDSDDDEEEVRMFTFNRYLRTGDNFFDCCYFVPYIYIDNVNHFIDKIFKIPHFIDTIYQWSNWTYYVRKIEVFNKVKKESKVLSNERVKYLLKDQLSPLDSDSHYRYQYVDFKGESISSLLKPIDFCKKFKCRLPIYRPDNLEEEDRGKYIEYFPILSLLNLKRR